MSARHADRESVRPEPGRVRSILILDQDEAARDAMAQWLGGAGYAVKVAADGHEAARWLAARGADLLIVDRIHPGWEGLGTLQAARQLRPGLRILVAAAGRADDPYLPLARAIGADSVLEGPLHRDEVIHRVAKLVT
ncbi:MAG: response regulator [Alphaproteobacteria bacterium]|nr:response regulator [Alphaproteobacteria bacterium]